MNSQEEKTNWNFSTKNMGTGKETAGGFNPAGP